MAISKVKLPDNSTQDINDERISSTDIAYWNGKQDTLVPGTNIKTVNNESLLGGGNLTIVGRPGSDGVGISSVVQTTESTESGGTNVITVTMSDGSTSTFNVRNGDAVGTVPIVQTTGNSTTSAMSQSAVTNELVVPGIVYTEANFTNDWVEKYFWDVNNDIPHKTPSNNYALIDRVIDIRDYDTVTFSGGANMHSYILIKQGGSTIIDTRFSLKPTVTRTEYPEMAYLLIYANVNNYSTAFTVTLSDGHHQKQYKPAIIRQDVVAQHNAFTVSQLDLITVYSGSRMTNKTIIMMGSARSSYADLLRGTIECSYLANWCTFYLDNNSSQTLCRFYQDGGAKQSFTMILTFDDMGNMKVYQNDTLKATCSYDALPDSGWELYIGPQIFTHFSILNYNLDEYISIINNYGWINWIPSIPWTYDPDTVTFEKTKGGWIAGGLLRKQALVHAVMVLTNSNDTDATYTHNNVYKYPDGSVTVPANSTVTVNCLIDTRQQGDLGIFGSSNQAGLSAVATVDYVVFEFGIDYRYCHEGGFFNLAGLEWVDCPYMQLVTNEVLPKVVDNSHTDGNVGCAVSQISVDASGNIYMFNGSVWKRINNS